MRARRGFSGAPVVVVEHVCMRVVRDGLHWTRPTWVGSSARDIPMNYRIILVKLYLSGVAAGAGATTYPHCRRARLSPIRVRTVTAAITDSRMSRRAESSSALPLAYSEESGWLRIYFT